MKKYKANEFLKQRSKHTDFFPALQWLLENKMYSVPAQPEWMTVSSVLPRVTNHADCLAAKQSLRPKMQAEKDISSKAKNIYLILLLICFGFFNSGM